MNITRKILKAFLILLLVVVAGFAGMIVYAVITDYKPGEKTVVSASETPAAFADSAYLTLLTWNIGYCGLEKDMDFFYDGGTKVRTTKEKMVENMKAVMSLLMHAGEMDFVFLQEVDRDSKRTYNIDQHEAITAHLNYSSKLFTPNYDVFFVPVPPSSPMGKVYSGITTLSRNEPSSALRYSFPGKYGFPKQLFMLDRCFLVNRYPVSNGKEVVIINTHNEAFDPGQIRKAQMDYLKEFILSEYANGNYIIAGGDWNQSPPGFKPEFSENIPDTGQMMIPTDFLPAEWQWVYDPKMPTNRSVVAAYDPENTTTSVIDFFLISPNVKAVAVNGIHLGFRNSDHNPVMIQVRLR